ncbi:MAG: DUF4435 domain-containing protein [Nitrospirae bacterium]|nr:DUF4435 domain-containing protein [Nitrospirota bacterium]
MNMKDIHDVAKQSERIYRHVFLQKYNKSAKIVYGFVEGKDDPSFYKGIIDNLLLPFEWHIEITIVGNKEKVLNVHKLFDWTRFPKKRIIFFVDRDLSEILKEPIPDEMNIYITDNYSIENDMVNRYTCGRVLEEVCNITELAHNEKECILSKFDEQLEIFGREMSLIMAWIIYWKRNNLKPELDKIEMNKLFVFNTGQLVKCSNPIPINNVKTIHELCEIDFNSNCDITEALADFNKADGVKRFIRGKYLLWFLVEYVLSIRQSIDRFSSSYKKPPTMTSNLHHKNAIIMIAPRVKAPASLRNFLEDTCIYYAKNVNTE